MTNIKGLDNKGNTCYLNSALQILMQNKDLVNFFINTQFEDKNLITFKKFVTEYHNNDSNNLNLIQVKNIVGKKQQIFCGFQQNDSTEYILLLLDILDEAIKKEYKNDIIDQIFSLSINQIVKCKLKKCNNISITKHTHKFLKFDIPEDDNNLTLDKCYNYYKRSEKLQDDNRWYCDKCKKKRIASKKTVINKWSKNLLIHLKRFKQRGSRYIKNNQLIDIPNIWKEQYHLKGMVIHSGSLNGGHYVSVVNYNDKWILCNDSSIKKIGSSELEDYKSRAYMFYYKFIL